MKRQYFVYILASKNNKAIYVGITSDLVGRIWQHKNDVIEGFTKRYQIHKLVYFEIIEDISEAILREKRIKKWKRQWKNNVINQGNPNWHDLFDEL